LRHECRTKHLGPRRPYGDRYRDVREQGERGQLDVSRKRAVVRSRGKNHDDGSKDNNEEERGNACEHLARIGHSCEIRPDIEHVRNEQRCTGHVYEGPWIVTFERARQASSRDEADAGARQFDRLHQRQRDHGSPTACCSRGSRPLRRTSQCRQDRRRMHR